MTRLLLKLPWFVSAPALIILAAGLAFGAHSLLGAYFERTYLNEPDPLAAAGLPPASEVRAAQSTARVATPTQPVGAVASPLAQGPTTPPETDASTSDPVPASGAVRPTEPPASQAIAPTVPSVSMASPPAAAPATPAPDVAQSPAVSEPTTPADEPAPPPPTSTPVPPTAVPTPPPPVPTPTAASLAVGVLAMGPVGDGAPGHNASGTAKLLRTEDGQLFLRFEDLFVNGGVSLYVFLTSGGAGTSNIDAGLNLGENRATDGNVNYEIPAGTDLTRYDTVVIWCVPYQIPFAIATLDFA